MQLDIYIRDIPDFPKPGILFRDITPLLSNPKAYDYALNKMAEFVKSKNADVVVAIESRGFMFACPVAQMLGLPFTPVRKPGKLPFKTKNIEYTLEYGSGKLEIHEDALEKGMRVVIVDDLLATGGTARGASDLVTICGAKIAGYSFLIELEELKGRELLKDAEIQSLIKY